MKSGSWFAAAAAALWSTAGVAFAETAPQGRPQDGGVNFQPPATPIMREIESFHGFLLIIITAIAIFVLLLLLWVMIRYNRRANPTPRKFTHNMTVEVLWTIIPVLILVAIAARSFPLIFHEERMPSHVDLTLKVTGNSWFWSYEYPDLGVQISSNLLPEDEANAQHRPYLLATDTPLVVPIHTNVRALITSNDVIHAWAIPSFGIKEDATQGRINDTWFNVDQPGTYYGQCSELCGRNHGFMPIEVHAVTQDEFNRWVLEQHGHLPGATPAAAPGAPATNPAPPATPTR